MSSASRQARRAKNRANTNAARSPRRRIVVIVCLLTVAVVAGFFTVSQTGLIASLIPVGPPPPIPEVAVHDVEPAVARAIMEARAQLEANPSSADAWGHYGMVCDIHAFYSEAATCYDYAMQLAPNDVRWPYLLGYLAELTDGAPETCIKFYRNTLAIRSDYWPALAHLGDVSMRQQDYSAAQKAYTDAAALAPNQPGVLRRLGQVQLELGNVRESIDTLVQAAALAPDDEATHSALAKAYRSIGDDVKAGEETQRASAGRANAANLADPIRELVVALGVSSSVAIIRADQSMQRGDFGKALSDLQIALDARPNDAAIHARLGRTYAALARPDLAIVHLLRAIELEPQNATNHVRLGSLLNGLGRHDEAVEQFKAALETDADNSATHALLAIALARTDKLDEALREFQRSADLATPTDIVEFQWANTLMRTGDAVNATKHYANAVSLNPNQPDVLYNMGIALEQLGRTNEAILAYQRAAQIDPNHRAAVKLAQLNGR